MNNKIDFIRYTAGLATSLNLLLNSLGYNIIANEQIVNLTNVVSFAYLLWLTHQSSQDAKQNKNKSHEQE
jgi:threonine/homoserine/homoserine lactone efflux protein